MSFLPTGYQKPQTNNASYFKFKNGDNRFRILSNAVIGYIYWNNENKPVRAKNQPTIQMMVNPKINPTGKVDMPKHFWAFIVFDYSDRMIKIMEITQKNIQASIYDYHADVSWGDPRNYDINIKKSGDGIETKYSVIPTPPSPLKEDVKNLFLNTKINLENLFTGDDPFNGENQTMEEEINIEEPPLPNMPF